jgi:class 3 adenylate cyclase/TM2 domain-containing membrane protein YozV
MKKIKRRLAAVMFTDMVGYSAMMQKDEELAGNMRDRHREVFRKYTAFYGGEILQYYGDGTLSIYPSAGAAVECAVDIQRELKSDPVVPIRIGIHTGDISYGEEDVFGDGVNIASRIESLCVPGGIFISGKVYDDIKNHFTLKARSLGDFALKNIQSKVEIYAITNQGITTPGPVQVVRGKKKKPRKTVTRVKGGKKRFLAGLLALFFGIFGTHRFYLGQRRLGILYLGFTLSALFVIPAMGRFIPIIAIISLIDAITIWSLSKSDFNAKFNSHLLEAQQIAVEEPMEEVKNSLQIQFNNLINEATKEYKEYDFDEAIEALKKAAGLKYDDPEMHFLLARCYSHNEEAEKALLHLDAAVAFGLKEPKRIKNHDDLAFLRIQPAYETFVNNGYRLPKELPAPTEDMLQSETPDLLEQLNKLQKLRKESIITKKDDRGRID